MKRLIASLIAVAIVCGVAWVCGFDFNERGAEAGFLSYCALAAGFLTYLGYPIFAEGI